MFSHGFVPVNWAVSMRTRSNNGLTSAPRRLQTPHGDAPRPGSVAGRAQRAKSDVVFVMAPSRALFASSVWPASFAYTIAASTAIPPTTVVAVDAGGSPPRSGPSRKSC
jgi:hypothetical protein